MLLLVFLVAVVSVTSAAPSGIERSPLPDKVLGKVVGILTQKTNGGMTKYGHSYIAASYVKYLEAAGKVVNERLCVTHVNVACLMQSSCM